MYRSTIKGIDDDSKRVVVAGEKLAFKIFVERKNRPLNEAIV
jgi:hypothetical protein